ncbi:MAG TPA: protein kinase, partial [Polyangiaceae bacterium]|nr:protein kinase [Polyangiaceae bacterium]
DYILQACEALAEAHGLGIVHRDLKPANLFLARQTDGSCLVKVLDFGISKRVDVTPIGGSGSGPGLTHATTMLGSPQYMSPEQVKNASSVDTRTDIWALGVVLYELLSDSTPFGGDTLPAVSVRIVTEPPIALSSLCPEVPRALEAIVERCLDKEPGRRFQSIAELCEALADFAPEESRAARERVRNLGRGKVAGELVPGRRRALSDAETVSSSELAPRAGADRRARSPDSSAGVASDLTLPSPSYGDAAAVKTPPESHDDRTRHGVLRRRLLVALLALILLGGVGFALSRGRAPTGGAAQFEPGTAMILSRESGKAASAATAALPALETAQVVPAPALPAEPGAPSAQPTPVRAKPRPGAVTQPAARPPANDLEATRPKSPATSSHDPLDDRR